MAEDSTAVHRIIFLPLNHQIQLHEDSENRRNANPAACFRFRPQKNRSSVHSIEIWNNAYLAYIVGFARASRLV